MFNIINLKTMKKIAIPTIEGALSAHFGHCQNFLIFDVENQNIVKETSIAAPPHEPGLLPKWLADMKVTDIISGGMGQRAIGLFNQNGINVFVGAPVKNAKEIVHDFINGNLETNVNLCDH